MKRSNFLKKIGLVFGAGLIAPQLLKSNNAIIIDCKPAKVKEFKTITVNKNDWESQQKFMKMYGKGFQILLDNLNK